MPKHLRIVLGVCLLLVAAAILLFVVRLEVAGPDAVFSIQLTGLIFLALVSIRVPLVDTAVSDHPAWFVSTGLSGAAFSLYWLITKVSLNVPTTVPSSSRASLFLATGGLILALVIAGMPIWRYISRLRTH
ncbi:MAG TPA: hypothetical protein VGF97_13725 [Rhizomicrobium sp.]|jgi:uncharacterized membrane protein